MIREPYNIYDYCAIALYLGRDKIGYVPMAYNFILARLLDGGIPMRVTIDEIVPEAEAWERVWVSVMMKVNERDLIEYNRDVNSMQKSNIGELVEY